MNRLIRTRYIPAGAVKIADKQSDAIAYAYTDAAGRPCGRVFYGKQSKPVLACYYRDQGRRELAIVQAFQARRDTLARKAAYRQERTAWVPDYKVGEILRTCWGYDQTNVEYFEIIEIKGKYAIVRELQQERVDSGFMQGRCVPLPGKYCEPRYENDDAGVPLRRLMQQRGIKIDNVRTAYRIETLNVGGVKVIPPASWSSYA
jgi:hypothetical protein